MFQLYSVVTSTLLIAFFSIVVINGNNNKDPTDLPSTSDLGIYLNALKDIFSFCSKHKQDLDMNFVFGLFIANVNLKKTLHLDRELYTTIPQPVQYFIKLLLKENEDLINFFKTMVQQNHDPREDSNKMIITLFSNETQWLKQLRKLDSTLLTKEEMWRLQPKQMFSTLNEYKQGVSNMEQWTPHPRISDMCLEILAKNKMHYSPHSKCKVYENCYHILINGTNFGYALTHRLLFVLSARLSRGCSIFSYRDDKELSRVLCTTAFSEAKYIARNNYKIVDLILEQMCLCSLAGFGQFLKRSWLSDILDFQNENGCFGQHLPAPTAITATLSRHPRAWKLAKHRDHRILGNQCDGHVTSVAAATLALAVRYIYEIETKKNGKRFEY
ncbi:hypothetical protein ABMA28_012266 [Loxostege sticticalis]|uniref:Uncharacterized protein n=1 Tax=Loxostege sticticalis TaxID=481309 RepID=A0ABD0TM93_LOXSC